MTSSTIKRTLATALTGAAIASAAGAPAASAMPADPMRMPASQGVREVIVEAPAVQTDAPAADGVDLAAAGLGAAGAGLIALLIAGGLVLRRPSPRRQTEA
jgi:hypothetical protein